MYSQSSGPSGARFVAFLVFLTRGWAARYVEVDPKSELDMKFASSAPGHVEQMAEEFVAGVAVGHTIPPSEFSGDLEPSALLAASLVDGDGCNHSHVGSAVSMESVLSQAKAASTGPASGIALVVVGFVLCGCIWFWQMGASSPAPLEQQRGVTRVSFRFPPCGATGDEATEAEPEQQDRDEVAASQLSEQAMRKLDKIEGQLAGIEGRLTAINCAVRKEGVSASELTALKTELSQLEARGRQLECKEDAVYTSNLTSGKEMVKVAKRDMDRRLDAFFDQVDDLVPELEARLAAGSSQGSADVCDSMATKREAFRAGGHQLSQLSCEAIDKLDNREGQLVDLEARMTAIGCAVQKEGVSAAELTVLKTELSQLVSRARQLEGTQDDICTSDLTSGREVAKVEKKDMVRRLEAFFPKVDELVRELKAKLESCSSQASAEVRDSTAAKRKAFKAGGHQLSQLSEQAIDQLDNIEGELAAIEARVDEIGIVAIQQIPATGLATLRTELRQLLSRAKQLEDNELDDVHTGDITSGKAEVKARKKGMIQRLEVLFAKVEDLSKGGLHT